MPVPSYEWPSVAEFLDRDEELAELEKWWGSPERTPMSLYGRRRCGKSWLFRRFAHEKPAVLLVARRTASGAQLDDFAEKLEPVLGVRPALGSVAELFRTLYRAARETKLLAVIDEFPYLLPTTEAAIDRELTAIAAVMEEERDTSQLKLVLCGSLVSQMEALLAEKGPLHGRLLPLQLHPVAFPQARLFLPELEPVAQFERYSITGGMPRYLAALGGTPDLTDLAEVVRDRVLNPNSALWDEGRTILEQELREPKVYFGILQELAGGDKDVGKIANALRSDAQRMSKYLKTLTDMRLVARRLPVGADPTSRAGHWHLRDPFLRFWFRFVFPFQDDLESGLGAQTLYETEVAPVLNDHVGPEFEDYCRRWTRAHHPVTRVGAWWGPALNTLRRAGERSTEEIDVVGLARNQVTLIGEARWRNKPMDAGYLSAIETYKLPALRQQPGLRTSKRPQIVLFSRGGYTPGLRQAAADREDLTLVDVPSMLTDA
jgi:AAA+ ATPase superfamily predicted ATPase